MKSAVKILALIISLAVVSDGLAQLTPDDPNTTLLMHFDGTGTELGDGYWRGVEPAVEYPAAANIYDETKVTEVAGKWNSAIEVGDIADAARWLTGGHYAAGLGSSYTTEFWWKPNFPKPDGSTNVTRRIWFWPNTAGTSTARYYVDYKYRASDGAEYLYFRGYTNSDGGKSTNTPPTVGAVNFDDFNYVAFRYANNSSGTDYLGVKLNDFVSTYKAMPSSGLSGSDYSSYFRLSNGVFDEFRVVSRFLLPTELEANRLLDRPFEPWNIPFSCESARVAGYGLNADLNGDCYVEWADFGIFAAQWQQCIHPDDVGCDRPWE